MAALKNPVHERFAREFIRTGRASEAYRKAVHHSPRYNVDAAMGWKWLHRRPAITRRIEELRLQQMKKSEITIEKILTDYQEALLLAKEQGRANDIVTAATAQAKLVGLLRERVETGGVGDFDNVTTISEILEIVKEEAGPSAALSLAKAFNLTQPEPEQQPVQQDSDEAEALLEMGAASKAVN